MQLSHYIARRCEETREEKEVEFLGYVISKNKVKPTLQRSQGIVNFKKPKTKKEMQSFLGCINYDRPFIKNMAELVRPLYQMTQGKFLAKWDEKTEEVFEKTKSKWAGELELRIPDPKGNLELESDASALGLGATLRQDGENIAYLSRALKPEERVYSITEREVLAALWAMEKLQYHLLGREFVLITDHKAIEEIQNKKEFGTHRVQRWMERLGRFSFTPKYRKGEDMVASDALSRIGMECNEIKVLQEVKEGEVISEEIMKIHERMFHRKNIMKELREVGIKATEKELKEVLSKCEKCQEVDKKYKKAWKFRETSKPGELVAMDILELTKNKRILLAIDYFTRKLYGSKVRSKKPEELLKAIERISKEIKIEKLLMDNGREFNNVKIKSWAQKKGIAVEYSVPYYHESNGRIERANRTIREAIKKGNDSVRIDIAKVLESYNETIHRGIGMRPNEAMEIENREKVLENQLKYKTEVEKLKEKIERLNPGDEVRIRNEVKRNKMDKEFENKGVIKEKLGNGTYIVVRKDGKELKRNIIQLKPVQGGLDRGMLDA